MKTKPFGARQAVARMSRETALLNTRLEVLICVRSRQFNTMITTIRGREDRNGERYLAPSILNDERYALESQVRECFGRCAYSHKAHEKMAERCAARLRMVKWLQIILSALTTGGAVGVLFDRNSTFYPYATAILATSLLILNSYVKDLDPGQAAQKHREAASDIWNVERRTLVF